MRRFIIITFLLLIASNGFGQIESLKHPNGKIKYEKHKTDTGYVRSWYFDNGELESQSILDKQGTWISYQNWNISGELVKEHNFLKERLEKGPKDLSFLKWKKLNKLETIVVEEGSNMPLNIQTGDTIVFHYRCLDELGYEYDNSIDINKPLIFIEENNWYLKSFANAIKKLKIGNKAYIRIPSELGYKDIPAGNVPPNTNLVYYVDILEVKRK